MNHLAREQLIKTGKGEVDETGNKKRMKEARRYNTWFLPTLPIESRHSQHPAYLAQLQSPLSSMVPTIPAISPWLAQPLSDEAVM